MIHSIFQNLLDVLIPPAEAVVITRSLTTHDIDILLSPTVRQHITGLLPFAEPTVRALVHANKFYHHEHASQLLSYALTQYLRPLLAGEPALLVPIPLGPKRARARGHNQVTTVLHKFISTNQTPQPISILNLLCRTHETPMQSKLSRTERLSNVSNCFAYSAQPLPPEITHVLVIDDVVTTGATLHSASRALRPHLPPGTKLTLLALAY